jgi:putative transposase
VSKTYQSRTADANEPRLMVPEQVTIAMAEIAEDMREGLLALAVGTGLQVMGTLMDADVTAVCGPRGKHDPDRAAVRHGHERGSVTLGGRRVPVERPRVRAADGSGELPVPSYELFSSTELLGRMALERMLGGLSSRRYPVGLEPVGERTEETARATSKSAVSRRFVAMTETALADMLAADLSALDLVALMVDGVHFAEHCCVVALGIGLDGTKHPLALVEGSTENATLVTDLLVDLRERGLDVTRPILAVLDGSKALAAAVRKVFDHPVIQRCQLHKIAECDRQAAGADARRRRAEDARCLPRRLRARRRGAADRARPGAGQDPPGRRGQPARGTGRDPDHPAPRRATDTRADAAVDERHRIDAVDLPRARQERQTVAGRDDGVALVRGRHARGRQAVPPRQWTPAPARTPRRARTACRQRNCQCRPA